MNTKTTLNPIIVQPGIGKDLRAFGDVLTEMLGGEQIGNQLSVMVDVTPPGGGPPLHLHHREDEIFLVVEGRISYCVNGEWTEVELGGVVYLPREVPHCYRNVGETPICHWIITTPLGLRCSSHVARRSSQNLAGPIWDESLKSSTNMVSRCYKVGRPNGQYIGRYPNLIATY